MPSIEATTTATTNAPNTVPGVSGVSGVPGVSGVNAPSQAQQPAVNVNAMNPISGLNPVNPSNLMPTIENDSEENSNTMHHDSDDLNLHKKPGSNLVSTSSVTDIHKKIRSHPTTQQSSGDSSSASSISSSTSSASSTENDLATINRIEKSKAAARGLLHEPLSPLTPSNKPNDIDHEVDDGDDDDDDDDDGDNEEGQRAANGNDVDDDESTESEDAPTVKATNRSRVPSRVSSRVHPNRSSIASVPTSGSGSNSPNSSNSAHSGSASDVEVDGISEESSGLNVQTKKRMKSKTKSTAKVTKRSDRKIRKNTKNISKLTKSNKLTKSQHSAPSNHSHSTPSGHSARSTVTTKSGPKRRVKRKRKKRGRKRQPPPVMIESMEDSDDDADDESDDKVRCGTDDSDDSENGMIGARKSLTGIWRVYYTFDILRDTDMTTPRYDMQLTQHSGGNIEGKCIEGSGPNAWTFLLTGKLKKGGTFVYTMHGEDEEVFGKATFDGENIIKNGMWYRDRLYLRKGGSLVAARKGTQLPRALMTKTDIKKMAKRKRDYKESPMTARNRNNLFAPPAKRQRLKRRAGAAAAASAARRSPTKQSGNKVTKMSKSESPVKVKRPRGRPRSTPKSNSTQNTPRSTSNTPSGTPKVVTKMTKNTKKIKSATPPNVLSSRSKTKGQSSSVTVTPETVHKKVVPQKPVLLTPPPQQIEMNTNIDINTGKLLQSVHSPNSHHSNRSNHCNRSNLSNPVHPPQSGLQAMTQQQTPIPPPQPPPQPMIHPHPHSPVHPMTAHGMYPYGTPQSFPHAQYLQYQQHLQSASPQQMRMMTPGVPYQSSGPITTIDGRIIPPEAPPKPKQKGTKRRGRPPKKKGISSSSTSNADTNIIVIDTSGTNKDSSESSTDTVMRSRAARRAHKKSKRVRERIKKMKQRKLKEARCGVMANSGNDKVHRRRNRTVPPSLQLTRAYTECDLTGAWSLYFDNSVNQNDVSTLPKLDDDSMSGDIGDVFETKDLYNYHDGNDEPINDDTLFLSHNKDTNEISGFVCSPLRCHVAGHVAANGIDVRLIMIWSPNQELGGQFAGYVTVINGEYDLDRGLNCEYCSFHCISFFQNIFWRQFTSRLEEQQKLNPNQPPISEKEKMTQFTAEITRVLSETSDNSQYVSIVEGWFHENEENVSPGQFQENQSTYSNQCIWRRRKLPFTKYSHIHHRILSRQSGTEQKKQKKSKQSRSSSSAEEDDQFRPKLNNQYVFVRPPEGVHGPPPSNTAPHEVRQQSALSEREVSRRANLPEFMSRDDRICRNGSSFFFGDLVQLFISFDTVLSHPMSYFVEQQDSESEHDEDDELEMDSLDHFGPGRWVDGIIVNCFEGKVLIRFYYERALYQQWIDCQIEGAVVDPHSVSSKSTTKRVTVQFPIRLRKQLTFSSHLNHIVSGLNRNALSEWRLNLQKSSVCFACDDDGNWAEAVVKRRYGCFVFVHWCHFDAEHDQFLSIHSRRIQPQHAQTICNRFRAQHLFEDVLQIKPPKMENVQCDDPLNRNIVITESAQNELGELLEKCPKTAAVSDIFGSLILHLPSAQQTATTQ